MNWFNNPWDTDSLPGQENPNAPANQPPSRPVEGQGQRNDNPYGGAFAMVGAMLATAASLERNRRRRTDYRSGTLGLQPQSPIPLPPIQQPGGSPQPLAAQYLRHKWEREWGEPNKRYRAIMPEAPNEDDISKMLKTYVTSPAVAKMAEKAWTNSFLPNGKEEEWGFIIVEKTKDLFTRTGDIIRTDTFITAKNLTSSHSEGAVNIDETTKPDEELLGSFHTHPYTGKEGGVVDVTFSVQDFWNLLKTRKPAFVSIVQTQNKRFALVQVDIDKSDAFVNQFRNDKEYEDYTQDKLFWLMQRYPAFTSDVLYLHLIANIAQETGAKFYWTIDREMTNFEEIKDFILIK